MIPGSVPILGRVKRPRLVSVGLAQFDGSSRSLHTFTAVAIGNERPDRKLALALYENTPDAGFISVTLGGIACTQRVGGNQAHIYTVVAPTGSTADIVIDTVQNFGVAGVRVYELVDVATEVPFDSAATNLGGSSISVDVPANGALLAMAHVNNASGVSPPPVWTGATEEFTLLLNSGTRGISWATASSLAAETARTINETGYNPSNGDLVAATWR